MNSKIKYLILIACMVFAVSQAWGQAPNMITYQGKLADDAGSAISGTSSVTFSIYAAPTGGTALYTVTMDVDSDANGIFTAELGPIGSSVFDGTPRYLGIDVEGDGEMTPRQTINSTPYSLQTEVLPGIAYHFNSDYYYPTTSWGPSDSITITVPESGYVVIQASGIIVMEKAAATSQYMRVSLSENSTAVDVSSFIYWNISSSPNGTYYEPFNITKAMPVTAGNSYEIYLISDKGSTVGSNSYLYYTNMLTTFYPTSYGTVINSAANNIDENPNAVPSSIGK